MKHLLSGFLALVWAFVPGAALAAEIQAFKAGGATILVSATTTAATYTMTGAGGSVLIYNYCTVTARFDTTGNTATTPTAGTPPTPGSFGIPPSTFAIVEIGTYPATVSIKIDSGSACNFEFTRGEGMAH